MAQDHREYTEELGKKGIDSGLQSQTPDVEDLLHQSLEIQHALPELIKVMKVTVNSLTKPKIRNLDDNVLKAVLPRQKSAEIQRVIPGSNKNEGIESR